MTHTTASIGLVCLICLLYFADSAQAFGAGNIGTTSKIEGQNWRHGDIEDTLLSILMARAAGGKKFTKLDVKRVSSRNRTPNQKAFALLAYTRRSTLETGFGITPRQSTLGQ
jgi:hypothetical protein